MRDDLIDTIRSSRRNKADHTVSRPRSWSEDDVAGKESMRKNHSLRLGYHRKQIEYKVGPLRKELVAHVGHLWNRVRADLIKRLSGHGKLSKEVIDNFSWLVLEKTAMGKKGRYVTNDQSFCGRYLRDGEIYVDDHGYLRQYRKVKPAQQFQPIKNGYEIFWQGEVYLYLDEQWYRIVMSPRPTGTCYTVRYLDPDYGCMQVKTFYNKQKAYWFADAYQGRITSAEGYLPIQGMHGVWQGFLSFRAAEQRAMTSGVSVESLGCYRAKKMQLSAKERDRLGLMSLVRQAA